MTAVDARFTRRTTRRWAHAAFWLVTLAVVAGLLETLLPADVSRRQHASVALAYTSLGALLVTLSIGPLNVVRGRRNPLSIDVRRDAGLASAVTATAHTVISLTIHFDGDIASYFFFTGAVALRSVRRDAFGVGSWTGAAAAVILLVLAAISSDAAVRLLGRRRWKRVQRLNYALVVAAIAHTAAFWFALDRGWTVVVVSVVAIATVGLLQATGLFRTIAARRRAR